MKLQAKHQDNSRNVFFFFPGPSFSQKNWLWWFSVVYPNVFFHVLYIQTELNRERGQCEEKFRCERIQRNVASSLTG